MERDSRGERVVFSLRTHPKVLFGPIAVLLMAVAGAVAAAMLVPSEGWYQWVRLACWGICGLLVLLGVLQPVLRWRTTTFTVTTRQIQTRSGLLGRNGSDVLLARIASVEIERGLLDRIFGCGTLVIKDAAATDGMVLRDIPSVQQVRQTISDLAYEAATGRK